MARSMIKRAARSATAPVRDYVNHHFEMVKEEVRQSRAAGAPGTAPLTDSEAWGRLAELESMLAEQSIHQARVLARMSDEVAGLASRIEDLERVVRQLATSVAPAVPER